MQISWLPEPEKHPLWADILGLLSPAAKFGGIEPYEPGDWVWIIFDGPTLYAAAVTRDGDGAELRLAGGHRSKDWIGLLDETVGNWALDSGAAKLTMRGRKGWARYARAFGWVALGTDDDGLTIYEKELTGE